MKLIVFGIDGATFDLILPWIENGYLPNIKKAIERGVCGRLKSTIPPVTPNAWVSFYTGKNCGKHGVIDFTYRDKNSYMKKPVSSLTYQEKTIWEILSDNGIISGYLNMPVTYPIKKIKGYAISGLLTPNKAKDFCYPPGLIEEVEKVIGKKYRIYNREVYTRGRLKKLKEDIFETLEIRLEVAKYLLKSKDMDFFMIHFFGSDRLQHEIWHVMDKSHPKHRKDEEEFSDMILEYYKKLDEGIGEILSIFGDEISYIIMSDHGFGPAYNYFFINNFLLEKGYIKLKNNFLTFMKKILFKIGITPYTFYSFLIKLKVAGKRLSFDVGRRYMLMRKIFLSFDDVDWKKTIAYATGNKAAQIFVNLRGREPEGIVEFKDYESVLQRIIEDLKAFKNIKFEIYRKEEIFSGEKIDIMPDIVCVINNYSYQTLGSADFISNKIVEPTFDSGDHRLNGIFIACGKIFKENLKLEEISIYDLAPTILFSLNCPVDEGMDGKVRIEVFKEEFLKGKEIRYKNYGKSSSKTLRGYTKREIEQLK
ncbi:MAG: hypothetical protein DRI22_01125, partial [Caldiserica bacterium]